MVRKFSCRQSVKELRKEAYLISTKAKASLDQARKANQEALKILGNIQAVLDRQRSPSYSYAVSQPCNECGRLTPVEPRVISWGSKKDSPKVYCYLHRHHELL